MESLSEKWLQKYLSVSLQLDCTCKGISVWKHGPQSAKNASVVILLHSICSKGELVITGIPCPWNLIHRGRWTTMLAYTQVWRSKSGHHTLWDIRCDYYEHKWTKKIGFWAVRTAEVPQELCSNHVSFRVSSSLRGEHQRSITHPQICSFWPLHCHEQNPAFVPNLMLYSLRKMV